MSYSFSDRNDYAGAQITEFNPYEYCNGTPVNSQGIESMDLFQIVLDRISREKMANRRNLKNNHLNLGFFRGSSQVSFLVNLRLGWRLR